MKKWVLVSIQHNPILQKHNHIMFSLHIHIKCGFHGVASLPFWNVESVPFLRKKHHTLSCGLQTFNMTQTHTKIKLHLLN